MCYHHIHVAAYFNFIIPCYMKMFTIWANSSICCSTPSNLALSLSPSVCVILIYLLSISFDTLTVRYTLFVDARTSEPPATHWRSDYIAFANKSQCVIKLFDKKKIIRWNNFFLNFFFFSIGNNYTDAQYFWVHLYHIWMVHVYVPFVRLCLNRRWNYSQG